MSLWLKLMNLASENYTAGLRPGSKSDPTRVIWRE